jgi:hypothetical protein
MSARREFIVIFGRDEMLLETRKVILKRAGYLTLSSANAYLARECLIHCNVGILVLCHTLSDEDVRLIVRFHHDMLSTAFILYLITGEREPLSQDGDVYNAQEGPAAFLATIQRLSVVYPC